MHRFTDEKGEKHYPGDVVELPASYLGVAWLEQVEPEAKVKAPPANVEPVADSAKPTAPAPLSGKKAKTK